MSVNKKREKENDSLKSLGWGSLVSGCLFLIVSVADYVLRGDVYGAVDKIALSSMSVISGGIILIFRSTKLGGQTKNMTGCISSAPGSSLLLIVEYLYSPKIVEQVFKPIVADWRTEYFDALKEGKNRKASWISIRYIFSFGMAMGLSKVLSVIRSFAHR